MRNIITILDLISYTCAIFALIISFINRKQIGLLTQTLQANQIKKDMVYTSSNIQGLPTHEFESDEIKKPVQKKVKSTKAKKKTGRPKKKSK